MGAALVGTRASRRSPSPARGRRPGHQRARRRRRPARPGPRQAGRSPRWAARTRHRRRRRRPRRSRSACRHSALRLRRARSARRLAVIVLEAVSDDASSRAWWKPRRAADRPGRRPGTVVGPVIDARARRGSRAMPSSRAEGAGRRARGAKALAEGLLRRPPIVRRRRPDRPSPGKSSSARSWPSARRRLATPSARRRGPYALTGGLFSPQPGIERA